jgi:hypothetical protein
VRRVSCVLREGRCHGGHLLLGGCIPDKTVRGRVGRRGRDNIVFAGIALVGDNGLL